MREGIETDLLANIAEQLKVPLSVIARRAELAQSGTQPGEELEPIGIAANTALNLVDGYLLGLQLMREQSRLPLEPVSVPMVLCGVAQELQRYGKAYGVDIDLQTRSKCVPAMAHREGLRVALLSLGLELIQSQTSQGSSSKPRLILEAHRTDGGVTTGMYGVQASVSSEGWRKSQGLVGRARQPAAQIASGTSAGLFVADTIFQAMFSGLKPAKYRNERGMTAVLMPSHQLAFTI